MRKKAAGLVKRSRCGCNIRRSRPSKSCVIQYDTWIIRKKGSTRSALNPITHKEEKKQINEIGSSHMARRTFIANLYNKVQDPNVIGSMTGHVEGSRAFSRYRTIEEDVKKSLVDILG